MVEFITLFLGLVAGVQPVELTVGGEVVSVELRLNGHALGRLDGEPWAFDCDLGQDLSPHRLVAVGFDAEGKEISRAEQWINLPRPRSEARFVVDEGSPGAPRTMRLLWSSVDVAEPEGLRIRFDGDLLEGATAERIELPPYKADEVHLLEAELELGGVLTRTETAIGGALGSMDRGLTAIPMTWRRNAPPSAEEMKGWLKAGGKSLTVVAVERGPAEVLMVQDLRADLQRKLARLQEQALRPRASSALQRPTGLKADDRFRVLLPVPAVISGETRSVQFPMSPDLWGEQEEVYSSGATERSIPAPRAEGILAGIPILGGAKADTSQQRLADGVASAALAAAASSRPRALVLITGRAEPDPSRFSAEAVRGFLQRLRIPLRVWSPQASKAGSQWGPVEDISSSSELFRAIRSLRTLLDEQIVVWVEGRHLPHEVALGAGAPEGLRLTGQSRDLPSPPG